MSICCEQNALLNEILLVSFTIRELVMFLDTHCDDCEALKVYRENCKKYDELVSKYTSLYGPITARDVNSKNYFDWVNNPWPWEVNF